MVLYSCFIPVLIHGGYHSQFVPSPLARLTFFQFHRPTWSLETSVEYFLTLSISLLAVCVFFFKTQKNELALIISNIFDVGSNMIIPCLNTQQQFCTIIKHRFIHIFFKKPNSFYYKLIEYAIGVSRNANKNILIKICHIQTWKLSRPVVGGVVNMRTGFYMSF